MVSNYIVEQEFTIFSQERPSRRFLSNYIVLFWRMFMHSRNNQRYSYL